MLATPPLVPAETRSSSTRVNAEVKAGAKAPLSANGQILSRDLGRGPAAAEIEMNMRPRIRYPPYEPGEDKL